MLAKEVRRFIIPLNNDMAKCVSMQNGREKEREINELYVYEFNGHNCIFILIFKYTHMISSVRHRVLRCTVRPYTHARTHTNILFHSYFCAHQVVVIGFYDIIAVCKYFWFTSSVCNVTYRRLCIYTYNVNNIRPYAATNNNKNRFS